MSATALVYTHTEHLMAPHVHGTHAKDMMVLHETISHDVSGIGDIMGVEEDLARRDYGIHGMNDQEGHMAWAHGLVLALFYHAGGVNERACGIEQVSFIPSLIQAKTITREQGYKMWLARSKQLMATAEMISAWHLQNPTQRPLKRSNGNQPGVCSHWDVSQHHAESEGHWDCQPHDKGGHYPIGHVIEMAKGLTHFGYHF